MTSAEWDAKVMLEWQGLKESLEAERAVSERLLAAALSRERALRKKGRNLQNLLKDTFLENGDECWECECFQRHADDCSIGQALSDTAFLEVEPPAQPA
jgi:hypothetical protein